MSVREIVLMGDPVLRAEAEFVEDFDERLAALVRDMFETMYHAEGIGLAAPQVGASTRVIVVDLRREDEDDQPLVIVNPSVAWRSQEKPEGCLSIPRLEGVVERFAVVRVEGFDPAGNEISIEADDLLARALQHEIDHIHGVLFLDHLSPLKRRMLLKKWKKLEAEGFEER